MKKNIILALVGFFLARRLASKKRAAKTPEQIAEEEQHNIDMQSW